GSGEGRVLSPQKALRSRSPCGSDARLSPASRAQPEQGRVVRVEGEAMRLIDLLREPGEGPVGDIDHGVAPMTDEVGMARCAQVVEGGAVPGVDVLDDTDLAETLQHPIHR